MMYNLFSHLIAITVKSVQRTYSLHQGTKKYIAKGIITITGHSVVAVLCMLTSEPRGVRSGNHVWEVGHICHSYNMFILS